jgi:hypothetical protein
MYSVGGGGNTAFRRDKIKDVNKRFQARRDHRIQLKRNLSTKKKQEKAAGDQGEAN